MCVRVCVCVHVYASVRECVRACMCVRVCASVCECVRACVRVCVYMRDILLLLLSFPLFLVGK